jgi:hypothetical protein
MEVSMGRHVWIAAVVAWAVSGGVAAQNENPAGNTITVTGCVQNFSTTATTGETEHGFILALNEGRGGAMALPTPTPAPAEAPTPTASGTSGAATPTGTSGTAAGHLSAATANSYMLIGSEDELKDHVGKRVEITGTVARSDEEATKGSTSTAPAPGTIPASAQRLQVASIRQVGSDCNAR